MIYLCASGVFLFGTIDLVLIAADGFDRYTRHITLGDRYIVFTAVLVCYQAVGKMRICGMKCAE